MAKASAATMIQREKDIVELIGQGKRRAEIGRMICGKYKCSSASIERQYDKLLKIWVGQNKDTVLINETKSILITRLHVLYEEAFKNKQWKVAADITDKLARMTGVFNNDMEAEKTPPKFNIVVPMKKVVPDESKNS